MAARSAALHGSSPILYEEHARIGLPIQCSGLISKKGLDALGIRYSGSVLNALRGANIHVNGSSLRVEANETKAFVVDRSAFDSLCAQEAEAEGARLITGQRAPHQQAAGQITIGADGVFSRIAASAGFPNHRHLVSCFQAEFSNATPEETHMVSVYLSRHAPGFFAWAIPLNEERVRVGLGVSNGKNPKKHFDSFVSELRTSMLSKAKKESALAGFIPLSPRKQTVRGRTLLVGDAAGQVKALSGGGVYFGCSCASIAGRISSLYPDDLQRYEREWRGRFGNDLALHGLLRGFLDAMPEQGLSFLLSAGKFAGAERFLVSYGDMDRPTETIRAFGEGSASGLNKRFNSICAIITNVFGSGGYDSKARGNNP